MGLTTRFFNKISGSDSSTAIEFPLDEPHFRLALDPFEMVKSYSALGGAQPDEVSSQFQIARDIIKQNEVWYDSIVNNLIISEDNLEREFNKILNSRS